MHNLEFAIQNINSKTKIEWKKGKFGQWIKMVKVSTEKINKCNCKKRKCKLNCEYDKDCLENSYL